MLAFVIGSVSLIGAILSMAGQFATLVAGLIQRLLLVVLMGWLDAVAIRCMLDSTFRTFELEVRCTWL